MTDLCQNGVTVLRALFPREALLAVREVAEAAGSYPVLLQSLCGEQSGIREVLLAPVEAAGLGPLLEEEIGGPVKCDLGHSWIRKQFAPATAPRSHHPNSWHQDGGLGVNFGPDPAAPRTMTRLVTCWIPLQPCGVDSPGLEFIALRLRDLLHYTELDDGKLRRRFPSEAFRASEMQLGDGLVLAAGTLHRTHVGTAMTRDRLSVEYRFFPAG